MSSPPATSCPPASQSAHYGAYALGCVVLTCFVQFLLVRQIDGSAFRLGLTFFLGATYASLGVLEDGLVARHGERWTLPIFYVLSALAVALLYVSPIRGYFGIIVLPMCSWAVFVLSPGWALAANLGFFVALIGVIGLHYGPSALLEAALSYSAAFAFTGAFTVLTRRAVLAREKADRLSAELGEANLQLRAHAAQTDELATTRERNRLAREIHDGVGHYLTVVKTQLDAAAALLPSSPEQSRTAILTAARLAGEALDEVRRSVGSLRTDAARPPLPDALRALAADSQPVPTVTVLGAPRPLPPGVEHALFRAAQEGLTNLRKHARASSAALTLDFTAATHLRLTLVDDGGGTVPPPPARAPGSGFGLLGLRERLELLGGTVTAAPRPTGGFALHVEVPA